jgi:hypothetical protein
MALRSNQTDQMAKFLQQSLQFLAPELAITASADASNNPLLSVSLAGSAIALIRLNRRTFDGFNIVAELDATAGMGFPEHECWLAIISSASFIEVAKLTKACAGAGASVVKFVTTSSAPAQSDLVFANATDIPNDPRLGSVGL